MEWLWANWWQVMDWLAEEPVTNWLSIIAGYVAFCVAFVTLGFPASVSAWVFRHTRFFDTARTAAITVAVLGGVVAFVVAMLQIHTWLNLYQHWYTTPLGPSL